MNPSCGYQPYQAQRTKTRAEVIAGGARLGRQAAALFRGSRALASKAGAPDVTALNTITALAAQATAGPASRGPGRLTDIAPPLAAGHVGPAGNCRQDRPA
jgi:hypothetical protein